jgi:hypothetical protein
MLSIMKKKKNEIPKDIIYIFERIECGDEFEKAMKEYLTEEQRLRLYEQNGACKGTSADNERQAFALKHADLPLGERLEFFAKTYGRQAVLNDDNTITVTFKCTHGYYKQVREKKITELPSTIESYFGRCAGGRLYEYEKALGIKLRIKSVDISPLYENIANPVVYTFEIIPFSRQTAPSASATPASQSLKHNCG